MVKSNYAIIKEIKEYAIKNKVPIMNQEGIDFLTTFIIIISIEILQFIFSVGTADIDDVILNLLGATISYIIFRNIKI